MHRVVPAVLGLFAALLLAPRAAAQPGTPPPPGLNREQMWPAPTAEDWKKPCLIPFQRTWDDALAVAKELGKPILVCVNMDGEIASEHYAGIRYRRPESARLYEPYVCVIASTYRHTPRDHDEEGNRILCPRFGSVTCGEHIWIEPILYEKFFEGERVAPRHVAVELDGSELHDVYYAWDVQSVLDTLTTTIAKRPPPKPVVRGDRTLVERVGSRDQADRVAVETAWKQGDAAAKQALLEAAVAAPEAAPVELLRLALYSFDAGLAARARDGLAKSTNAAAVPVIAEALSGPVEPAQRDALVAALERLGGESARARTLAVVHQGLSLARGALDAAAWTRAPDATAVAAREQRWQERLAAQDAILKGADATAHLELGEALLDLAQRSDDGSFARLAVADAQRALLRAHELGAHGHRVEAGLAVAARWLGDEEEARRRALAAVTAGAPDDPTRPEAMVLLELFARTREKALGDALRDKRSWPPEWLADLNAAYTAIARHPDGRDDLIAGHYDVLQWLGARRPAARFLEEGLARFPASDALHDRLRTRALERGGPAGIEEAYAALLAKQSDSPALHSYAGYGALVAAEFHRRAGANEAALAAYDRAIAGYERAIALLPEERDSADHYVALALAGKARVAFEAGDDGGAVEGLLRSFARREASAATQDGLNISPVDTAKMVQAKLAGAQEPGAQALRARLDAAMAALDPKLLELPEYERRVRRAEGS